MLQEAVGQEAGRYEVRRSPQALQACCRFAAHGGDFQPRRPVCQAAAPIVQPLLHGLNAIGAGEDQPVEVLQLVKGIVQRSPILRWADHQGRQVYHRCALLLKHLPSFGQLLFGPGDGDGAPGQGWGRGIHGFRLTIGIRRWRRLSASAWRFCRSSSVRVWLKPSLAAGMSPSNNRARARFW